MKKGMEIAFKLNISGYKKLRLRFNINLYIKP